MIRSLQAVDVKSLPEEVREYTIKEEIISDVKLITAEAAIGGIGMTNILFDISSVRTDDIHYSRLFTALVGNISTQKHTAGELATLMTRYLNNFSVSLSVFEPEDEEFVPVIRVSWISLMAYYHQGLDLVKELIFETDISKIDEIKIIVNRLKTSYRSALNSASDQMLARRAYATSHDAYRYYSYANGLEFYGFLLAIEKQLEENPSAFISRMKSIQDDLANKDGAAGLFAGNEGSIEMFKDNISYFFEGFNNIKKARADYSSIEIPERSEAIVIDSSVQFNLLYASLEELGIEYNGKFIALGNLIYDAYLIPQIRHVIGAYDNIVILNKLGIIFISYRDLGISATYDVYKGLGGFLESASFTQEDIDSYIINAYSAYVMPVGELTGAMNALSYYLEGKDPVDEKLEIMRELKSFTVEDVHNMSEVFDKMYSIGVRSTSGGASIIEQNKERFLNIITPIAQGSDESYLTRGDVIRLLFGDIPEAMEMAVQMGIITGDGRGNYREDDLITRQEFAVIIFRILGITYSSGDMSIADFNEVSTWARDEVLTIVEYGLLSLDENGKFSPKKNITMSDFERLINKLLYM